MWAKRIIHNGELARYISQKDNRDLPSRLKALYEQQRQSWPQLRRGHDAMKKAQVRKVSFGGCWVLCQYTPHRIASVSARVDPISITNRSCFLCPEDLYPEEKGLPFGEHYFILCNVSPIFDFHFVITHREHVPQQIKGHFDAALDLTRRMSPEFVLIYNGPRCGASAPDHFHFQAFPGQNLPLQCQVWVDHVRIVKSDRILIAAPPGFSRRFLVLESDRSDVLTSWFHRILEALAEAEGLTEEPMINLVMGYGERRWRMVLFPRAGHRPQCYYAHKNKGLLISPGAIDMAGVFVIPRKNDYYRVNAEILHRIYQEVTPSEDRFSCFVEKLRGIDETGAHR